MIKVCDLRDGVEYWNCELIYSSKTFRVILNIKPRKCIFHRIHDETDIRFGVFKDEGGSIISAIRKDRDGSIFEEKEILHFYPTEKECIEAYNAMTLRELDKLQNYYETKKDYLNKKLIKNKKERV